MLSVTESATLDSPKRNEVVFHAYGAVRDLFRCRDKEVLIEGPAGCIAGETLIDDVELGPVRVDELYRHGRRPLVKTMTGPVRAGVPFVKGYAALYRLTTMSGKTCVVHPRHLFLTPQGWRYASALAEGELIGSVSPDFPATCCVSCQSGWREDDRHCGRTTEDSIGHYSTYHHRYDEQPLGDAGVGQGVVPLRDDVLGHNRVDSRVGDSDYEAGHTRSCPTSDRPSKKDLDDRTFYEPSDGLLDAAAIQDVESGVFRGSASPSSCLYLQNERLHQVWPRPEPSGLQGHGGERTLEDLVSSEHYKVQWDTVQSYTYERHDWYYDLTVPIAEHYVAEGLIHHNTGKSFGAGHYINWIAETYPGCRILVLRKTRVSLSESFMVTFEAKVLPPDHEALERPVSRSHRVVYQYGNGSQIVLGGMDNPTRLFSSEYDIIYVQEATELTEAEWESLHRALRNGVVPWQQLLGDCNPDAANHWLNTRCHQKKTTRLVSKHIDNPTITQEYLARLESLTGVRRKRLYDGLWCSAEGMVYEDWDAGVHVIDEFHKTNARRIVASKDWGFRDPGVTQLWAVDNDSRMVCIAELYQTAKTVDWWLEHDLALASKYDIDAWVADPSEPGYIEQYRRASLAVYEADNDIMVGLRIVQQRLRKQADGRYGLYFLRDCLQGVDNALVEARQPFSTTQEFETYVYEEPKDGKALKEKPVDYSNHGMDAMRYACMFVDRYSDSSNMPAVEIPDLKEM